MPGQHTEYAFETAIEHHLTTCLTGRQAAGGYVTGDRDGFDPHRAIFPADVLAFIKTTQPDEYPHRPASGAGAFSRRISGPPSRGRFRPVGLTRRCRS